MSSSHRSDILFVFALLAASAVVYFASEVLLLIYVSALLAVVINPAVELVRKFHIGHWWPGRGTAIVFIVVAALALLGVFFAFMLPPIFRDLQAFASDLPRRTAQAYERMRRLPFAGRLDPATFQQHAAAAMGGAFGFFRGVAGGLFAFFSCLILTVYFIIDGRRAFYWLMTLVPHRARPRLQATFLKAEKRVRHWLLGQLALMLILGVTAGVAFGLMRIRYFYALAVIAGVLNIVPILGPIVLVVLASIVAVFDSWTKLLGVWAFYFLYHETETAYLTPKIMKYSVDLPPLAVIVALTVGGALAGIVGALIAVPTAALVAVFIEEYLVKKDTAKAAEA
jgi:predicted PurR-regulated permease PerM